MSIEYMTMVFKSRQPANSAQRLVLLALADHANDEAVCWPSIKKLSDHTCLSIRGVQYAIRNLEAAGLLKIKAGGINSQSGQRYANTYTLTLKGAQLAPTPAYCAPTPAQSAPLQEVHPSPAPDAPTPLHATTYPPAPDAPQSSGNHHIEPSLNPQEGDQGLNSTPKPKRTPKAGDRLSPQQVERMQEVGALMRRRAGTRWSAKELAALHEARLDDCSAEDFAEQLETLRAYYHAKIAPEKDYRRRDLLTLLNNWTGELDRARAWVRDHNDGIKKL
jgi:DNA-binding MarR family transcriptional regulator